VTAKHDVIEKAGIGVGNHTKTASKRRNSERVSQAEMRSKESIKNTDWPGAKQEKGMRT